MPRSASIALAGLAALAVAMGIGRFAFTPILPMMQEQGLSLAAGSWLASANYAGYLAGALFAGAGLRPGLAMRAGLLAIGVVTFAMGLTSSLAAWLVLRFTAGVASAWVLVHVSAWCLARLAALGALRLDGVLFAGVGVGSAAAGLLCAALMRGGGNAGHAWFSLGALSLALTAALWPALDEASETPARRAGRERFAWTPEALRLVACYGAYGFGYIIPATFVPAMAKALVPDPRVFGWAWPIFGLTAAASTLLAARLRGRVSDRQVWRWSIAAMALGVASPVLFAGALGIVLAAALVGGTFVVVTMAAMQEARRLAGEHAAPLMAALTAAFALGQVVGPLSVPLLVAHGGFAAALLLAAALLALSALLLPRERR
ncbi:MAG TPA: YbfB/YjiJ family MFS transporter [Burkholderiales bacterium]